MSGMVGLVHGDGRPVDRALLERMTQFLAFRGPDAQKIWCAGSVGFGHTLLSTREETHEEQPAGLAGEFWITADVRLDRRSELIEELRTQVQKPLVEETPDVELLLYAYQIWGEGCLAHLLGDFAFVLWDAKKHRLFGARDHFGVKPFYYALLGPTFVFSNTLACLHLYPEISRELHDLAIADFLLFGFNQEVETTAYRAIRRLPPAHFFFWEEGRLEQKCYWRLPHDGCLRFPRPEDYLERFRQRFQEAVGDRLRTDHLGISMSGGMDSSSVAAMAHRCLSGSGKPFQLEAYTAVIDSLMRDEERYYAGLVADHLKIPIHYQSVDDYGIYERLDRPELGTPEPAETSFLSILFDRLRQISLNNRVGLTGMGGDPLLYASIFYLWDLLTQGRWLLFGWEVVRELAAGRRPPLALRAGLAHWLGKDQPPYPGWIAPALEQRLSLRERWREKTQPPANPHPFRANAHALLCSAYWPHLFENFLDAGAHRLPLEIRHPFFDRRLVEDVLAMPPLPWFGRKYLLREAMAGLLPEAVRRRPKAIWAENVALVFLRQPRAQWTHEISFCRVLENYVAPGQIPQIAGCAEKLQAYRRRTLLLTRPMCLHFWLLHQSSR